MRIRYILLTIFLCSSISMVSAGPGPKGQGANFENKVENRMERLQKRLHLSDDQAGQIRAIMEAGRAERNDVLARYGVDPANRESRKSLDPEVKKQMREELKQLRQALERRSSRGSY